MKLFSWQSLSCPGITCRYTVIGIVFGVFFPLVGTAVELITQGLPPTIGNLVNIHSQNPLLWIIDTAPIFLGLFALGLGLRTAWRIKAEKALRKSEERLWAVINASYDAMIAIDSQGKIIIYNPAAEKFFGYTYEEMIGKSIGELMSASFRSAHDTYIQDYFSGGKSRGVIGKTVELTAMRKNGELFPIELSLSAGRFSDDYVVFAIIRDITERKESEETLKASEGLLRATLESTADGILVVDHNGVMTNYNRLFVKMWNIPDHLLEDKFDEKLISFVLDQLTDPEEFISKVKQLYGNTDVAFDILTFKNGRVFERFSRPLILGDKAFGRLWSFRDVTERAQAEQQREDLQNQLNRAEKMKSIGMLAGGVAHDLNNMLGPLVGYPELILRKYGDDPWLSKQIRRIETAARDAADVIQDLLTLARRGRYKMVPTDINAVIETYLDSPSFERLRSGQPNIKVHLNLAPDIRCIRGSSPHLAKIIMNLLVNAFEAMPEDGLLTISTREETIASLTTNRAGVEPGDYIILSVVDNGSGIRAEDLKRIFEPYYSKKEMGSSGSGLGLAVVYGILKDHDGFYDIISELGQGTEFILYFPAIADTPEIEAPERTITGGKETILIVDDNEFQREMASEILTGFGYNIVTASGGREAVAYLKDNEVDLVLLDMIMETGFDGLDTYREILTFRPHQKTIIISGYSRTDRVDEVLALGAGQYIKKPYTVDSLGAAVRKELDIKTGTIEASRNV